MAQDSEQALKEYKEVFSLYDDNEDGLMKRENVPVAIHSLSIKTTQLQLEDMMSSLSDKPTVNFD